MKNTIVTIAAVAALSLSAGAAQAGGWGAKSSNGGLLNLGNVNVLNGVSVLNGSPILSGNIVSGILSGNKTSIGNGTLNNIAVGILGGNQYKAKKSR